MRLSRIVPVTAIALVGLLVGGCSDDGSQTEEVEPALSAPEEPVLKTAGRIVFEGIPDEGVTAREVTVLEKLESEARARLQRQRQLFEYKLTGQNPELEDANYLENAGLPPEDRRDLERRLAKLRTEFPEILMLEGQIDDPNVDDDRIRKVPSDAALHEAYEKLFKAIRWDNLQRGIEFIRAKLETDSKVWIEEKSTEDPYEAKQVQATLQWLSKVQGHLKDYVDLFNAYLHAKNAPGQPAAKVKTWERFLDLHRTQLIIDVSQGELASATLSDDGSFEADAQGELLVRVEYGFRSAYFLVDDPEERRVSVTELERWTEEPDSNP